MVLFGGLCATPSKMGTYQGYALNIRILSVSLPLATSNYVEHHESALVVTWFTHNANESCSQVAQA